jgi:3-methyladenine DNA glycosylase AlkD
MKATELVKDIRVYCKDHADEDNVKKYARYFTEGYDAYGLTTNQFNDKVSALLQSPDVNLKLILAAGKLLIKSGKYEEASFAICLVKGFSGQFDLNTFREVETWFQIGIGNWAHTDIFCGYLMTPFFEKGIISLKDLSDWRRADNKYQRRAVPVAMLPLLKTVKGFKALFAFIEPLMTDPEEKVQQGLGWFLREAWKIKRKETEAFLLKWKNTAGRKIFQYATEKMTAAEKKKFKKEKINNTP